MRYRFIQIGIVINDDGIFPTHLGDDLLDVGLTGVNLGGTIDDAQTCFNRTGEGDERYVGMINHAVADN